VASRANFYYDTRSNKWVLRRKGGTNVFEIPDSNNLITNIYGFVGSNLAIASIGLKLAVATITGATGLKPGDKVFGTPKVAPVGNVTDTWFVPTNNTLVAYFSEKSGAAGSLVAQGWDILAVRSA
jgi:hypothetical protein